MLELILEFDVKTVTHQILSSFNPCQYVNKHKHSGGDGSNGSGNCLYETQYDSNLGTLCIKFQITNIH